MSITRKIKFGVDQSKEIAEKFSNAILIISSHVKNYILVDYLWQDTIFLQVLKQLESSTHIFKFRETQTQ